MTTEKSTQTVCPTDALFLMTGLSLSVPLIGWTFWRTTWGCGHVWKSRPRLSTHPPCVTRFIWAPTPIPDCIISAFCQSWDGLMVRWFLHLSAWHQLLQRACYGGDGRRGGGGGVCTRCAIGGVRLPSRRKRKAELNSVAIDTAMM